MLLYAIQRISDGKFLPAPPLHYKGGQTAMEFDYSTEYGVDGLPWMPHSERLVPRLFATYSGANTCLKMWLKGAWEGNGNMHLSEGRSRSHLNPNDYAVVSVNIIPVPVSEPEPRRPSVFD